MAIQSNSAKAKLVENPNMDSKSLSEHRQSPPKVKITKSSNDRTTIVLPGKSNQQYGEGILKALATSDPDLEKYLIRQVKGAIAGEREIDTRVNIGLAQLHDIAPTDSVETMLALQMIGVHSLAMKYVGKALEIGQTTFGVDNNLNRATRLMRTFAAQVEAMNRYRRKGQQNVIVEHVHVNDGGQAIVGSVSDELRAGRRGG